MSAALLLIRPRKVDRSANIYRAIKKAGRITTVHVHNHAYVSGSLPRTLQPAVRIDTLEIIGGYLFQLSLRSSGARKGHQQRTAWPFPDAFQSVYLETHTRTPSRAATSSAHSPKYHANEEDRNGASSGYQHVWCRVFECDALLWTSAPRCR